MKCDLCGDDKSVSKGIVDGVFGCYCRKCIQATQRTNASEYASYSRDRDREDHRRDVIQPFDHSGKPNPEFIRAYPDESKTIFDDADIRNA